MEDLYQEGRVRAIGVCNCQKYHLDELLSVARVKPVVNQFEGSPLLTQKPLIEYTKSLGIAVEFYSILGGTYSAEGAQVLKQKAILDIAERLGKMPAQVIIKWAQNQDIIVVVKSSKEDRLASNINIDFELTADDMKAIDALNKDMRFNPDPDNIPEFFATGINDFDLYRP